MFVCVCEYSLRSPCAAVATSGIICMWQPAAPRALGRRGEAGGGGYRWLGTRPGGCWGLTPASNCAVLHAFTSLCLPSNNYRLSHQAIPPSEKNISPYARPPERATDSYTLMGPECAFITTPSQVQSILQSLHAHNRSRVCVYRYTLTGPECVFIVTH